MSRARKQERSGRWRQPGARLGSAREALRVAHVLRLSSAWDDGTMLVYG